MKPYSSPKRQIWNQSIKVFRKLVLLLFLLVLTSACGESKDRRLGKLESKVEALQAENNRLKKESAISSIDETGRGFVTFVTSGAILVVNNLVWLIVYRRKQ